MAMAVPFMSDLPPSSQAPLDPHTALVTIVTMNACPLATVYTTTWKHMGWLAGWLAGGAAAGIPGQPSLSYCK
jgi:hypothetical protein